MTFGPSRLMLERLPHRVFYVATFAEAVYVLHVFEKKTRKTSRHDIELGNERFKAVVAERTSHGT